MNGSTSGPNEGRVIIPRLNRVHLQEVEQFCVNIRFLVDCFYKIESGLNKYAEELGNL